MYPKFAPAVLQLVIAVVAQLGVAIFQFDYKVVAKLGRTITAALDLILVN